MGANAAAGQAGANQAFADQGGELMTSIGNAQAGGTIGSGNAWQQAIAGRPGTSRRRTTCRGCMGRAWRWDAAGLRRGRRLDGRLGHRQ